MALVFLWHIDIQVYTMYYTIVYTENGEDYEAEKKNSRNDLCSFVNCDCYPYPKYYAN